MQSQLEAHPARHTSVKVRRRLITHPGLSQAHQDVRLAKKDVGPFPSSGKMVRVRRGNGRELVDVMESRLEEGVRSRERGCGRVDWYRDDAGDGEHAVE